MILTIGFASGNTVVFNNVRTFERETFISGRTDKLIITHYPDAHRRMEFFDLASVEFVISEDGPEDKPVALPAPVRKVSPRKAA